MSQLLRLWSGVAKRRVVRVFHRVVEEVLQHDLQGRAVGARREARLDLGADAPAREVVARGDRGHAGRDELAHVDVAEARRGALVGEAARLEHVVDEGREAVDVVEHHALELPPLGRAEVVAPERLGAELERRERALELVGHRVDEAVLPAHPADLPRQEDREQHEDGDHRGERDRAHHQEPDVRRDRRLRDAPPEQQAPPRQQPGGDGDGHRAEGDRHRQRGEMPSARHRAKPGAAPRSIGRGIRHARRLL